MLQQGADFEEGCCHSIKITTSSAYTKQTGRFNTAKHSWYFPHSSLKNRAGTGAKNAVYKTHSAETPLSGAVLPKAFWWSPAERKALSQHQRLQSGSPHCDCQKINSALAQKCNGAFITEVTLSILCPRSEAGVPEIHQICTFTRDQLSADHHNSVQLPGMFWSTAHDTLLNQTLVRSSWHWRYVAVKSAIPASSDCSSPSLWRSLK